MSLWLPLLLTQFFSSHPSQNPVGSQYLLQLENNWLMATNWHLDTQTENEPEMFKVYHNVGNSSIFTENKHFSILMPPIFLNMPGKLWTEIKGNNMKTKSVGYYICLQIYLVTLLFFPRANKWIGKNNNKLSHLVMLFLNFWVTSEISSKSQPL